MAEIVVRVCSLSDFGG
jgi:hypothetical protein